MKKPKLKFSVTCAPYVVADAVEGAKTTDESATKGNAAASANNRIRLGLTTRSILPTLNGRCSGKVRIVFPSAWTLSPSPQREN